MRHIIALALLVPLLWAGYGTTAPTPTAQHAAHAHAAGGADVGTPAADDTPTPASTETEIPFPTPTAATPGFTATAIPPQAAPAPCTPQNQWAAIDAINWDSYTQTVGPPRWEWDYSLHFTDAGGAVELHPFVLPGDGPHWRWWRDALDAIYNDRSWISVTRCGQMVTALTLQGVTLPIDDMLRP